MALGGILDYEEKLINAKRLIFVAWDILACLFSGGIFVGRKS